MPTYVYCTWRIDMQFSVGVWTSVRADVVQGEPVRWKRGQSPGALQTDRTPQPGSLEFTLRNDAGNSGHLQGYYSPNHTNCRSGFTYGIPVRLVATYSAVDYTVWTGKIRTIDPAPGRYRTQRTVVTAQDIFADLAEASVREITPQLSKTEVQLLQAIIAALPTEARPTATSYDSALDTYTYALDNVGAGAKAIGVINDVTVSALGFVYGKADGTFKYENRHTRSTKSSSYTLDGDADGDDIVVPSGLAGVFNRIRVKTHPRTTTAGITLYQATGPVAVAPGQTVTVWGTYQDPSNTLRLIGAAATTTPLVASTDYVGNAASNGSGADLTSYVAVSCTPFATVAMFDITNSYTDTVYLTTLKLRGTGIFDNTPQTFESFSSEPYGDRPLDVDLKYQDNSNIGQDMADYLNSLLSNQRQVLSAAIKPNRSNALMLQALAREIGDVITLSETVTGTTSVRAAIAGVEGSVVGVWLMMRWMLTPQSANSSMILDDAVYGVLDAAVTTLGWA